MSKNTLYCNECGFYDIPQHICKKDINKIPSTEYDTIAVKEICMYTEEESRMILDTLRILKERLQDEKLLGDSDIEKFNASVSLLKRGRK